MNEWLRMKREIMI